MNPIMFYQKFISPLKPPCCRYYPTCSNYAQICFKFENPLIAAFKSIARIIKCNQIFRGGIEYPRISHARFTRILRDSRFKSKLDSRFKIDSRQKLKLDSRQKSKQKITFWFVPSAQNYIIINSLKKDKI